MRPPRCHAQRGANITASNFFDRVETSRVTCNDAEDLFGKRIGDANGGEVRRSPDPGPGPEEGPAPG